ncbi:unnamed protein product [Ostreobium quekettii]|uniref:Uncharacterized protein n=1 Tax=Ostreobium quekettii TaxID=121088 RepID=A0A8S1IWQ9_9CHLO|nr:unnamed protein product [Ostreobium quekettii]
MTREGSSRDLSWDTWDIWCKMYEDKFGPVSPSTKVPKLAGANGFSHIVAGREPGNYRLLYHQKIRERETKRKQIGERAKGKMEMEKQEKESRKVQMLTGPVPKRRKGAAKQRPTDTKREGLMKQLGISGSKGTPKKLSMTGSNQRIMNAPLVQTASSGKRKPPDLWGVPSAKRRPF